MGDGGASEAVEVLDEGVLVPADEAAVGDHPRGGNLGEDGSEGAEWPNTTASS
jgi:hypothetical protein